MPDSGEVISDAAFIKEEENIHDGLNAIPYRQIRAVHGDETIRVYQAFSTEIGESAGKHQVREGTVASRTRQNSPMRSTRPT